MTRNPAQLLTCIVLVACAMVLGLAAMLRETIAQPTPLRPPDGVVVTETELEDFLRGDPASSTKSKTCLPMSIGAKQEHVGRPPVNLLPPGGSPPPPPPLPGGEFRPHVFVTCSLKEPGPNLPAVFFVPVTPQDQAFASQALSIMGAAHLSGKHLKIVYDPQDRSGDQIGCKSPICKRILAISTAE